MDANAWSILAELLEMAGNEFSHHGYDDFELPNTPENQQLVEAAEMRNSPDELAEYGLSISEDGTKLYAVDWFLMDYFAHLAREMAESSIS